jgi:hypothetical protein
MERSRNWPAWIALALAGLALVVALGGRADQGGWRPHKEFAFGSAQAGRGPDARFFHEEMRPDAPAAPLEPDIDRFMQRGEGFGPRGDVMMWREHHRGPGFLGLLGPLFLLSQLAGLALLGWLIFKLISDRRNPPAATPPAPDPRVE